MAELAKDVLYAIKTAIPGFLAYKPEDVLYAIKTAMFRVRFPSESTRRRLRKPGRFIARNWP